MTTIAANRFEMVADSRVSLPDTHFSSLDKIEVVRDEIVGTAGDTPPSFRFLRWFRDRMGEMPEVDEFQALVLNQSGLWLYAESCYPIPIKEPFFAIGSGSMAALAAMHAGASPSRAVEIACMCDKNSGLPLQRVTLKSTKKR